ncbi:hypothetical protein Bca101_025772 [Brassica carinata]
MLSKGDKYTVRTLYDRLEEKAQTMTRLERLSIGIAIITEGIIIAGNSSSLIPKQRLMAYKSYDSFSKMAWGKLAYAIFSNSVRSLSASSWKGESYEVRGFVLVINLWAMSSMPMLGKALGKPCKTTSSADPLCLHWDSTRSPTITEVLEVEKKNNVVVTTVYKFSEEFKHLVNPTHPDDVDFDSVVQLVQQGYKVKKSDWEQGFVYVFLTTEDIGRENRAEDKDVQQNSKEQTQDEEEQKVEADAELGDGDKERETSKVNEGQTLKEDEEQMEAETELEEPVLVERQKQGRENKRQTLEEEEEQMEVDTEVEEPVQVERQKQGRGNKEQKKSGEKRKDEVHEKNKEKNQDEDGSMSNSEKLDKLIQMIYDLGKRVEVPDGSSNKQDYENLANFFDDTKGATNDKNEEEVNRGDKRNAADDENDEEICDEEAISAMQQLTKVNTFGENENTKVTGTTNDENEEEANPGDKRNAADDENDEEICDEKQFLLRSN